MKKLNKHLLSLLLFLGIWTMSNAQTMISGIVNDDTKSPLIGATVAVKGTLNGTTTDINGKFALKITGALPVTLVITTIGYQTVEMNATKANLGDIQMKEQASLMSEVTVSGTRFEERITKAAVTVEKITARQMQLSPSFDQYSTLQSLKGVDLLSQSMTFKSVNLRGFGANNNNRFVQLTDGMDNRSPGLGFGFGSAAGVSDLDIESIEILPGASSALYGPDALQGLMLTKTKSPFEYTGLAAQVKVGVNNIGKTAIKATPYTDVALRFAKVFNNKLALKVNLQAINGTDFIADDYSDRWHRDRPGFFITDANTKSVTVGGGGAGPNDFRPNNDPNGFQYDGVNIYGDDFNAGGATAAYGTDASVPADLRGKQVTRTGYTEYDLTGDKGKVFSYRANAALHYKLTDKIEAIGAIYYGNGNFTRTAGQREYFPDFKRTQYKLEIRADNFFVRGYNTSQEAEGFNMGNLAARMLQSWKTTAAWGNEFKAAYAANPDVAAARAAADAGKPLPGTPQFTQLFDKLTTTLNTDSILPIPGGGIIRGVRALDNSSMAHFEGMYNFKNELPEQFEVVTGASYRKYSMLTKSTLFPTTKEGKEFTIAEYGAYVQGSYSLKVSDLVTVKPTIAVRYDKNEFFAGGFTPRISGIVSVAQHNFRASWQSAFRNPSPNQLLADGKTGEIGGAASAVGSANIIQNPAYTNASVTAYRASKNVADLVPFVVDPSKFTTEKIKTWEIGYKSLIANQLYVDAFYFGAKYTDFIAAQPVSQAATGSQTDLLSPATTVAYGTGVNFNNFNEIFVNGWGVGLDYAIGNGYNVAANYAYQVGTITLKDNFGVIRKDGFGDEIVNRKMSDPAVSKVQRNFFISPENRFNFVLSNPKVTKDFGFNITYRWTDKMWVEQGGTQGDIWLPSWQTVDVSVMYKLPKYKTNIKLGASNLTNKYYSQGYGLAQIGGMYYISLNFDDMLNR
jgi:iron complex outermembrane recepter protein